MTSTNINVTRTVNVAGTESQSLYLGTGRSQGMLSASISALNGPAFPVCVERLNEALAGGLGKATLSDRCLVFALHLIGHRIEVLRHSRWEWASVPQWFSDAVYRVVIPPPVPLSVDWAAIDTQWKYVARDADGRVYAFSDKPVQSGDGSWRHQTSTGKHAQIDGVLASLVVGTEDWHKAIIERPAQ